MCRSSHTRVYLCVCVLRYADAIKRHCGKNNKSQVSQVSSRRVKSRSVTYLFGQRAHTHTHTHSSVCKWIDMWVCVFERAMQIPIDIPFDRPRNNVNSIARSHGMKRPKSSNVRWLTWTQSRPCRIRDFMVMIVRRRYCGGASATQAKFWLPLTLPPLSTSLLSPPAPKAVYNFALRLSMSTL